MIKILFICHGNICRSPLAEFYMKDLARKAGLESRFVIASAATSTEELGNPIYPPMRETMRAHSIPFDSSKRARRLVKGDYSEYDHLICMDERNRKNILRIIGEDAENKVRLLLDFTDSPREVADPWYTRDFERAYEDIAQGCGALMLYLGF